MEKAESVIIASPYLSGNIITYWREKMVSEDKANFTIIYDIGNEQEGRVSGLEGRVDEKIKSKITWRHCNRLHTKFYYFKFKKGYSFYHGSANFTNYGLGQNGHSANRNKELLTKISDKKYEEEINKLVESYLTYDEVIPIYIENSREWEIPPVPIQGIIKEYDDIIKRLEKHETYEHVNSNTILKNEKNPLKYVSGLFRSKNYKYIKVHTTNDTNSPNFTISRQELKWFLGNFLKANCKSNNRKLLFVIKEDGIATGRLTVLEVKPVDLFDLFATSKKSKKVYIGDKLSVSINTVKTEDGYFLNRYSKNIEVRSTFVPEEEK